MIIDSLSKDVIKTTRLINFFRLKSNTRWGALIVRIPLTPRTCTISPQAYFDHSEVN